jgi:hypothetical protein
MVDFSSLYLLDKLSTLQQEKTAILSSKKEEREGKKHAIKQTILHAAIDLKGFKDLIYSYTIVNIFLTVTKMKQGPNKLPYK